MNNGDEIVAKVVRLLGWLLAAWGITIVALVGMALYVLYR